MGSAIPWNIASDEIKSDAPLEEKVTEIDMDITSSCLLSDTYMYKI